MCVCFVVQLLSCVWLFATPWTAAHQASLSFTISWSLLKLMSIKSMMSFNHFISVTPFSSSPNLSQIHSLCQWVDSLHQVTKELQLQLQHPSSEYSGLISFRIDWFELLSVQDTLIQSFTAPQFETIHYLALSLFNGATLIFVHD